MKKTGTVQSASELLDFSLLPQLNFLFISFIPCSSLFFPLSLLSFFLLQ